MYGTSKYRARDMGVSRNFCLYGSKTCHVLSPQLKDETTTIGESPTSQAHDFLVRFCENITWLGVWTHGIPGQLPHWPVIDDESSFWIWKDKLLEVRVMFRSWCWVSGDRSATFLHVSLVIRIFTMFIGARLSATAVLYPNNHLQQFIHYPHMSISKVWIYRLLFVCLFFCVFVRLRISPPRHQFCTAVHRCPKQRIAHFCELSSPRSPKSDESASARATPTRM